jgi:hypothetical protein
LAAFFPRGLLLWEPIMAKITKPDANPVVALLLSLVFQLGHFLINGQQKKWVMILVCWLLGHLACCIGGPIVAVFGLIEAYKTAVKLKAGKEIDENEYSFELMYKIAKYIHKEAIYVP